MATSHKEASSWTFFEDVANLGGFNNALEEELQDVFRRAVNYLNAEKANTELNDAWLREKQNSATQELEKVQQYLK